MDTNVTESRSTTLLEHLQRQVTHINITPDQDVKPFLEIGVTRTGKAHVGDAFVARNLTNSGGAYR